MYKLLVLFIISFNSQMMGGFYSQDCSQYKNKFTFQNDNLEFNLVDQISYNFNNMKVVKTLLSLSQIVAGTNYKKIMIVNFNNKEYYFGISFIHNLDNTIDISEYQLSKGLFGVLQFFNLDEDYEEDDLINEKYICKTINN